MHAPIRDAMSGLRGLPLSDANFYYSNTTIKKRERTIGFFEGVTICFPSSTALLLTQKRQHTNLPLPFLISSRESVIFLLSVSLVYTDFCQNGDEGWKRSPLGPQHRMLTDQECFLLLCHRRVIRRVFFFFLSPPYFHVPVPLFVSTITSTSTASATWHVRRNVFEILWLYLTHPSGEEPIKKHLERWGNTWKVTGWTICPIADLLPCSILTMSHRLVASCRAPLYVLVLAKPVRSSAKLCCPQRKASSAIF